MTRALLLCAATALACGLMPPPADTAGQSSPPPVQPPANVGPPPLAGYHLVWSEEFDGSALDTSRWTAANEPRRAALSTPDAVSVHDGVLQITTYTEAGVDKTGFVKSDGKFEIQYGYFEARIKFDDAPGEWCAFWLQSPTNGVPLGDPAHAGVEIDVAEHRVTDQGGWQLADYIALNLNWDGYGANRQNASVVTNLPNGAHLQGEWHDYGVLWTATGYTFYVDGIPLWATQQAVSQRTESLELTCEIADASWAGFVPKGGYGTRATSTTGMQVDWVHIWQPNP